MANGGRHSKLAPSAAHRWYHCTASVEFIESLNLTAEESPYATEGTLAHETLATALGMENPFAVRYRTPEEKEYLPYTIEYVQHIRDLYDNPPIYRERRVNPQRFLRTRHCKGTADVIIPIDKGPLYIIDLKFGVRVAVDIVDNLQLIIYGLGAYADFCDDGYDFTEIVLVISQPRTYHADGINREWRLSIEELLDWGDRIRHRAKEALNPAHAHFRPQPDGACRFCPAQGVCRALAEYELRQARRAFEDIVETEIAYREPSLLEPEELSHLLRELPGMRRWMSEVSAYALRFMQDGGHIPYWDLKTKLGNRKWALSSEDLELYFADDVLYQQTVRSPAQVEKLLGKGSVEALTTREETGTIIVETDNPEATEPDWFDIEPEE